MAPISMKLLGIAGLMASANIMVAAQGKRAVQKYSERAGFRRPSFVFSRK